MAYSSTTQFTIDNTKVGGSSGTLSNVVIYISGTFAGSGFDPDLRTTGSGGDVVNTGNGGVSGSLTVPEDFDISSDEAGTNGLSFEITSYDGSTGAISLFVKIPTLNKGTDTNIYFHCGDAAVTVSQENITDTWADYEGVFHFDTSPTGTIYDSSGTANAVVGENGDIWESGDLVTAKLNGGYESAGTGRGINLGNIDNNVTTAYTFQCWFKADQTSSARRISEGDIGNTYGVSHFVNANQLYYRHGSGSSIIGTSYAFTDTVSYHLLHQTWDGATVEHWLDGTSKGTLSSASYGKTATDSEKQVISSRTDFSATQPWDGVVEEVRWRNSVVSDDQIVTEYNNMNSPSTFGSFTEIGGGGGGPVFTPRNNTII